jgi:RHS repeat-associated protein
VYDAETGLYYLRARYYDPSIGRFLNEDTYEGQIDNPLSLNLYTYVHNNPLIYSDPSGNYCVSSNGNNTHAGFCSSTPQKYEMSDVMIEGMPYINNGVLRGYYRADASIIWLSNNETSKQSFWQFMTKSQYQEYVEAVPLGNMIVMGGFSSLMSVATAPLYASKPEAKGTGYNGTRNTAIDFTKGNNKSTLSKHFGDHGGDFGYKNETQYLRGARNFVSKSPTSTTQSFTSNEGTYFRYDSATNEFGIINQYGGISTYFKPTEGINYWKNQVAQYAPK